MRAADFDVPRKPPQGLPQLRLVIGFVPSLGAEGGLQKRGRRD